MIKTGLPRHKWLAMTMWELERTFEDAGIEFINDDKGEGLIMLKK